MGRPRMELHEILKALVSNVYFQPPNGTMMKYPCIVYSRDFGDTKFADNFPYAQAMRYQIQYIDRDPDASVKDSIASLPMCAFERFYTADDLNHDVYNLYF